MDGWIGTLFSISCIVKLGIVLHEIFKARGLPHAWAGDTWAKRDTCLIEKAKIGKYVKFYPNKLPSRRVVISRDRQ